MGFMGTQKWNLTQWNPPQEKMCKTPTWHYHSRRILPWNTNPSTPTLAIILFGLKQNYWQNLSSSKNDGYWTWKLPKALAPNLWDWATNLNVRLCNSGCVQDACCAFHLWIQTTPKTSLLNTGLTLKLDIALRDWKLNQVVPTEGTKAFSLRGQL